MIASQVDSSRTNFKKMIKIDAERQPGSSDSTAGTLSMLHLIITNALNNRPDINEGGIEPIETYKCYVGEGSDERTGIFFLDCWTIKQIRAFKCTMTRLKHIEDFIAKQVYDTYYQTKLTIRVYQDIKNEQLLVITNAKHWTIYNIIMNCVCSLLPVLCPWWYVDKPSDEEIALMEMFVKESDCSLVDDALTNLVNKYMSKKKQPSIFERLARKAFDNKVDEMNKKIKSVNVEMERLMNNYMDRIKELEMLNTEMAGMKYEPGKKNELDEYLESCEGIECEPKGDNILVKVVSDLVVEEDAAAAAVRNRPTWMMPRSTDNRYWTQDRIAAFIRYMFIDKIATMKVMSAYTWDFGNGESNRVYPDRGYVLKDGACHNPHHLTFKVM